ncbi:MAG: Rdx family protein [bacterium]|nr:Rdx family protein [bacterium]
MAEFIKKQGIDEPELIPSSGGAFEVRAGGLLLFSKLREHRFPEPTEVLNLLKTKAGA